MPSTPTARDGKRVYKPAASPKGRYLTGGAYLLCAVVAQIQSTDAWHIAVAAIFGLLGVLALMAAHDSLNTWTVVTPDDIARVHSNYFAAIRWTDITKIEVRRSGDLWALHTNDHRLFIDLSLLTPDQHQDLVTNIRNYAPCPIPGEPA